MAMEMSVSPVSITMGESGKASLTYSSTLMPLTSGIVMSQMTRSKELALRWSKTLSPPEDWVTSNPSLERWVLRTFRMGSSSSMTNMLRLRSSMNMLMRDHAAKKAGPVPYPALS